MRRADQCSPHYFFRLPIKKATRRRGALHAKQKKPAIFNRRVEEKEYICKVMFRGSLLPHFLLMFAWYIEHPGCKDTVSPGLRSDDIVIVSRNYLVFFCQFSNNRIRFIVLKSDETERRKQRDEY
jgi:hypothetical protein